MMNECSRWHKYNYNIKSIAVSCVVMPINVPKYWLKIKSNNCQFSAVFYYYYFFLNFVLEDSSRLTRQLWRQSQSMPRLLNSCERSLHCSRCSSLSRCRAGRTRLGLFQALEQVSLLWVAFDPIEEARSYRSSSGVITFIITVSSDSTPPWYCQDTTRACCYLTHALTHVRTGGRNPVLAGDWTRTLQASCKVHFKLMFAHQI